MQDFDKIYCSPARYPCANRSCERHICHAPHGCCVTTEAVAACELYRPRIVIRAHSVAEAAIAVDDIWFGRFPEKSAEEMFSMLEFAGLSVNEVVRVRDKFSEGRTDESH